MFVWESLFSFTFKGYRISLDTELWVDSYFFFQYFKDVTLLSSCLHGFWWEVCCSSYPSSSVGKVFHFPLAALKIFSLSLFFWVMVCLGIYVHFLCVFLNLFCLVFSELLGSLIWCLSLILENFWPFLQIFFSVLFFFFWYSIYAYIIWFGIVSSSWMFRPALFTVFSLCFNLFNFYCTIFNITNFFCFIMSSLLMSLTKGILHTLFLIPRVSIWISLTASISLLKLHVVYLFH